MSAGQYVVDCAAVAFSPPDIRMPPDWGEEHIRIPNSARGTKRFHRLTNPAMNEPLCRSVDTSVRRLVVLAPTGAGKTTIPDIRIPFGIANALGSMLVGMQSDADADDYCEKRLNPILDSCAPVVALAPTGKNARHLLKLSSRTYPECTLDVGGPGKTNAQRKSVQWVGLDEAWLIKYGMIGEFEKRLHDRWNGQLCLMSQGAVQEVPDQKSELDEYWRSTDQAELQFRCWQCNTIQPYLWDSDVKKYSLRYEKTLGAEGGVDYQATGATARMICGNSDCGCAFTDTPINRRRLAESMDGDPHQYIATAKPEKAGYAGRHFNVLAMWWVSWSTVVIEWVKAVDSLAEGDSTLMVLFVTKRLARTWWLPKQEVFAKLTAADYKEADYFDGEKIDGEVYRFMAVDVQMDHFWVVVRAFRADGSSRKLYSSKVESQEMVRTTQLRLKVLDALTYLDSNYFPGKVYDLCVQHGWMAAEGDKAPGFLYNSAPRGQRPRYITRYYSQADDIQAPGGGRCQRVMFSRVKVTDETVKLRDGNGPAWEHGQDCGADWQKHAVSEHKVETKGEGGKPTFKYVKIKGRRNDLWWCEVAITCLAIIMGVLRPAASEMTEDSPDQKSDEDENI